MKQKVRQFLAVVSMISMLGGCAAPEQSAEIPFSTEVEDIVDASSTEPEKTVEIVEKAAIGARPMLIQTSIKTENDNTIPKVSPYTVSSDLSNIDNLWQFYNLQQGGEIADKLAKNGFVVTGNAGAEFFEIYEENRYEMIPNFVTVDSLMHTYHLYFAYLLKNIEKEYLSDALIGLSKRMLENSQTQYKALKGTEWESAAKRNVAFFTVGSMLLDSTTAIDSDVEEIVSYELNHIRQAQGIDISQISSEMEDYSQYIPRGYYEGDEQLEQYFKAMMWYGRMHFTQKEEDMDRSALLMTLALSDDAQAYGLWESIYAVTSFFAGASDDLSVCEYATVLQEAYGMNCTVGSLAGNADAFLKFHSGTAALRAPQINSIPIWEEEENVIAGFRFMGQRFTIDAAVMQRLIYKNVGSNSAGDNRMLPDALDVPAAFGSDMALKLLEEQGDTSYAGYLEAMEKLRAGFAQENTTLWSASLYAGWLHTLRPLLNVKGEGYPMFMQNEEWLKKDLECFAGSYAELKHDTVLYAKQVYAEMGGGGTIEEPDDRGYVEPEPLVYERFAALASQTAQGLKKYKMLDAADEENLLRLQEIAKQLFVISNKELQEELLTDEEFEFIRAYGGYIEHFWNEAAKRASDDETVNTLKYPAAIVTDIATDPDRGQVLEVATGNPSEIYVAVRVDGTIKIARGSVYSFYQFSWPMNDRLTDTKWRQMMGIEMNDEGRYNQDKTIVKPSWTESYRYHDAWE
ncbi:MAG: DUF3160 domain-containing protein [Lachnospiraceae bacterium]|jgi:Protein of unknown function (DUF3160).